MILLLLSLILSGPDVSVVVPDSVEAGVSFNFEIIVTGEGISSVNCTPVFSDGLQYLGSSNMNSFSSTTTPTGTTTFSEIHLSMSFAAFEAGTQTIGPLVLTSSGREIMEIPLRTLTVLGNTSAGSLTESRTANSSTDLHSDELAWMEIEIDTTGRVYPGQTFNIDYYAYKTQRNAEIVDLSLEPSDYATSNLVGDVSELQWVRCKNGVYKTWLATLEVTPAFACTLSLPVLKGRIGIPGGMMRPPREYYISTIGEEIPVYSFPDSGKPDNFSGITDELFFNLEKITTGYSSAGERCVQLSVSGPGYSQLEKPPELTVSGPAELVTGSSFSPSDDTEAWYVLVEPSDSGRIIIGPDSIAWFNTSLEKYRQAIIPPCTLSVYPIADRHVNLPILENNEKGSSLIWILTVSSLLVLIILLLLRHRNRITGSTLEVSDSKDVEELLTAMGYRLSKILTGSGYYMGAQELDEALDKKSVDIILERRLLRHWKDLEMLLSGKTVSNEQFEILKNKSMELIHDLNAELARDI